MIHQLRSAVEFASHLPRYNEILRVLFKYGFADVLKLVALQRLMGIENAELQVHETGLLSKPPAERLRLALEELGPTFIKFGQILSARRDLVNDDFYAELCKLHDSVPTFPGKIAKAIFAEEIGIPVSKAFKEFDDEALAGASIAQVHRAVTQEGAIVAVKVQRPEIQPIIERDLAIILDIAKFVDKHVAEISALNPVAVITEFADTLRKELDFTNEAANAERFGKQFAESDKIAVPAVLREFSREKILTVEFISGFPVGDTEVLEENGIDPVKLSEDISVLIYQQIFEFGFFHGDPHPGNMTVLEGGVVGLYDYGMMGAFSPGFRSSVAHLIAGLAEKNHRQVMRSIIEMSEEGVVADQDRMLREVEEFSDQHLNQPLSDINLGYVLNSLLDLLRNNHLRMKGSFYLGIKALSQVEAIGRSLNPQLNFVVLGEPYASKLIQNKYHPFHIFDLLKKLAAESVDFLEDFPYEFRALWDRLRRGQINIPLQHKIDPEGFEPLRKTLDSIANRLTNAILAASVLICSSILILSGLPPRIWDVPVIGMVGLIWGAYMCLRLVLSIWKHGGL
ncbi:MAG TPA: AarF/ABC1/UbiB kinase family protein [Chthoniobacterales bacterium]